ncbi:M1 family metallopeptidase [Streptomyces sp. NPDC088387]|uniref:M1 family metallopeptidase n=1 Tax=Streptomyces sp. NPDC088387 TaxID=3365859 RepID=UPI003806F773
MVSRPHRIAYVSRFAPVVPGPAPRPRPHPQPHLRHPAAPLLLTLALALSLSACSTADGVPGSPGGPGVGDPYFPKAGNGGYDVTHYALDLGYEPAARRLTGRALVTARATKDLSAFDLDLKGMHVDAVEVDGLDARWRREGQELIVSPPRGLARDAVFRVAVRYSGRPVTVTDPDGSKEGWLPTPDGALALGQPVGSMAWFPGSHHPSDKATYDIAVTVPKGLRAVSNGELAGERTGNGRTTFTWRTAEPMASYLATVAIGRFDITRTSTADGLPVYTAVDPAEARDSKAVLARIPEVLTWTQQRFGPYPFSSTGAVVDRLGSLGYALETQNRPVFPGAPSLRLLVHEIAHQWYGDSVTPKTWRDMWLNEGFATYAEWLWEEEHGGLTAQETFDALYAGSYYADADENRAVWAFPPGDPPDAAHISGRPVYDRGAMVLHKIRRTMGDSAFRALLADWPAAHRHGHADTRDFMTYVEQRALARDFAGIWKDWLYGRGRPERP